MASTSPSPADTPQLITLVNEAADCIFTACTRLELAIQQGADPNERAWDGETALMAACINFNGTSVDLPVALLVNGADPGLLTLNGSSALSAAVYANALPVVRLLLEHGGQRVRQAAVAHGLERLLETAHAGLMAKEVAVYSRMKQYVAQGHLCLADAKLRHRLLCQELSAWFAQQACAEGLPAAAVAPSTCSGSGDAAAATQPKSPLLSPAVLVRLVQKGDVARLKQALELGADPNTADNGKITLLMHATRYNHPHIVQLLIDTGRCDLELRNMQGQTALHDSAATGRLNIAQQLISAGCDINVGDCSGATALHLAVDLGHSGLVPILVAAGADVNAADVVGMRPLLAAAFTGNCAAIVTLLDAGADINCRHCSGCTPLIAAAMCQHPQAVQLLLSRGADPNAPDDVGLVPLTWAEAAGGPIREALLQAGAQAGLSVEEVERQASEHAAAIDLATVSRCVAAALIPESRQRQALKEISDAQQARETALAGSSSRSSATAAGVASAQPGASGRIGNLRTAGSSSRAAKPSERSREEADRMAAQLLAEEEAEKAKAHAAQAKKQQKARQRAKAQCVATAAGVDGAEAAGQQQEQGQLDSAGSAGATATPGAVAVPVAAHAPTSQLAGLTLAPAPASFALGPSGTAAPPPLPPQQQQQQPPKQRQQQQQPQKQQPQQQGASAASQACDDERCCVVCMDRPRNIVLVPCGHVALCQECCDAVQEKHNECPMCRAGIEVAVALNL